MSKPLELSSLCYFSSFTMLLCMYIIISYFEKKGKMEEKRKQKEQCTVQYSVPDVLTEPLSDRMRNMMCVGELSKSQPLCECELMTRHTKMHRIL